METLPPQVQKRLKQLSAQFVAALPDKMEEIRRLWTRSSDSDTEALRSLRYAVHRLAGSAATFGLANLTELSRAAEDHIERDLASEERVLSVATAAALEELVAWGDASSAATASDETREPQDDGVQPSSAEEGPRRFVVLAGSIPGLGADFGEQLAVFGLTLLTVREPSEIGALLASKTDSDSGSDAVSFSYVVFLSTVQFLSERLSRLSELAKLRDAYSERLLTALVGDQDDFEKRLRSVRYGADVFLSLPLDTTQLVERLETLMADRDAQPYHVLIVDDDPDQVSNTALVLQNAGMITSVVTDPRNIFQVMVEYKPELILMDMYMPECTGAELAGILRQNNSFVGVPIVFLSVETDAGKQLAAIQSGADDFLVKPIDPAHLVSSVKMRAARTRAMRFYMERDSLTGLLNHTNLKQRLEDDLARARRVGTELVFAMIDIDHFKHVNDTYGHLTGDRVLKGLSRLLQDRLRRTDVVGRYGGEEFGVILFNTDVKHAHRLLNELRDSFSRLRQSNGDTDFRVTFSCGIAAFPDFDTVPALNAAADGALYRAKETGRNRVVSAVELLDDESTPGST